MFNLSAYLGAGATTSVLVMQISLQLLFCCCRLCLLRHRGRFASSCQPRLPHFLTSWHVAAVIAVRAGWNFAVGVAACWLGLFGPGILLLYGFLPFWGSFRRANAYRRALPGLASAAVGLVVMALFAMYDSFTCASASRRCHFWTRCSGSISSSITAPLHSTGHSNIQAGCACHCAMTDHHSTFQEAHPAQSINTACILSRGGACRRSSMFPKTSVVRSLAPPDCYLVCRLQQHVHVCACR